MWVLGLELTPIQQALYCLSHPPWAPTPLVSECDPVGPLESVSDPQYMDYITPSVLASLRGSLHLTSVFGTGHC